MQKNERADSSPADSTGSRNTELPDNELSLLDVSSSAFTKTKPKSGTYTPPLALGEREQNDALSGIRIDVQGYESNAGYCGVYALKMVMAHYHRKDVRNQDPPGGVNPGEPGESHRETMVSFAKRSNLLYEGGGISLFGIVNLAEAYGYKAWSKCSVAGVIHEDIDDLKAKLDQGIPPLVCIAAIGSNGPERGNVNANGHWAVVKGFRTIGGVEYMIVVHDHSSKNYIWRVSDFEKSWADAYYGTVYVRATH